MHFKNDLTKGLHGIFTVPTNELVGLVDEAWSKVKSNAPGIVKTVQSNGKISYLIPIGRTIGQQGGNAGSGAALDKIRLVLDGNNSNEVFTVFPE